MNVKGWHKAGAAAVLSAMLMTPAYAFLLFGPENATVTPAVEYYNAKVGEYHVTVSSDEIAALDAGSAPGWARSKTVAFYTIDVPAAVFVEDGWLESALPVCRYFIPPASHFLSVLPYECAALREGGSEAVLETDAAFYAWPPDAQGRCPLLSPLYDGDLELAAVYRLWDARNGSAHRFTTSRAERDAMVAEGWVSEGYGDDGVAMCVPPSKR